MFSPDGVKILREKKYVFLAIKKRHQKLFLLRRKTVFLSSIVAEGWK
jgi:hypothetical protein